MWAQRSFGTPAAPGVYSKVRCGAVDIFLTDGRYSRQTLNHILGQQQLDWLKVQLSASTAPVKLIVSGSAVLPQFVKTIEDQSWEGWERDAPGELGQLLGYIEAHDIRGVVFASGDLHLAYLMHRPGTSLSGARRGPEYWELISSPLRNEIWGTRVKSGPNPPTFDPYCLQEITVENYGILDVDLDRAGREVLLTLKNSTGLTCVTQEVSLDSLKVRPLQEKLTAVVWNNGKCYFFKGTRYARYNMDPAHEGVDPGYPMEISGHWPGMTGTFSRDLSAGLIWPNGRAYFFQGNGYVQYIVDPASEGAVPGYPKYVSNEWPGLWAGGIDAAVLWPNGKAYFFKGTEYVRYNADPAHEGVEPGYPKPILGNWPGLAEAFPHGIDTAVVWSGSKAYFFKGDQYVRYNIDPNHEGVDPGYPQPIAAHWPGLGAL